jgi:hypothetical protein
MSKLAVIDPARVDLSTLAALLLRLDQRDSLDNQHKILTMLAARTLGKLRGMPALRLLIHALDRWGGNSSHFAAAGAISIAFDRLLDSEDFYIEELAQAANNPNSPKVVPPAPDIVRLLFEPYSGLGLNVDLMDEIRTCRQEFRRNFGDPVDGPCPIPGYAPAVAALVNGPIVGTIRKVALDNMESLADRLTPGDIACLTEPRIVDALFENAGAFLIDEVEANASLGERLRRRNTRFASFKQDYLHSFRDGQSLVLWPAQGTRSVAGLYR